MIGLDLDGVLAEFCKPFLELATLSGWYDGPIYETPDQKTWEFDFDTRYVWEEVNRRQNWWMGLPPMPELRTASLRGALNRLIQRNRVAFVTSRRDSAGFDVEGQARAWLVSVGLDADESPVVTTRDKGHICRSLGVTHFLDDKPSNLDALRASGVHAVRRAWKYNEDWNGPAVGSVSEFLDYAGALT